MMDEHDLSRRIRTLWQENKWHGFLVVISENAEEICIVEQDDFSVALIEQEDISVWVQSTTGQRREALSIATEYQRNREAFKPKRDTAGSFLLVDRKNRLVIGGRDRAQAYHFHYLKYKGQWWFSTNLLPICGLLPVGLDTVACDFFLQNGIVAAPLPLVKGVHSLRPGHYVSILNGKAREDRFWKIQRTAVPSDYGAAAEQYGSLLIDNIKRNITGDTAGLFLSGGSDSAAVVGALTKLGVENIVAAHMEVGDFPTETSDVASLHEAYGFQLLEIKPPPADSGWLLETEQAVLRNQPGSYETFPLYKRMGEALAAGSGQSRTVFNGELCLLDQGFSVRGDALRSFKRWLYTGGGHHLSRFGPLLPESLKPRWNRIRRVAWDRTKKKDWALMGTMLFWNLIYSLGRPAHYYAGSKLGVRGMPGLAFLSSYLPQDYEVDFSQLLEQRFFKDYAAGLAGREWRETLLTMTTAWYSETSNLTMPLDAAAAGGNAVCFPFSSVDLMDFAASLPVKWTVDKKIQKDMCVRVLDMPVEVAYRQKDHHTTVRYPDAVYGQNWKVMKDQVMATDFGPLQVGLKTFFENSRDNRGADTRWFSLFALSKLMAEYEMAIS